VLQLQQGFLRMQTVTVERIVPVEQRTKTWRDVLIKMT